MNDQRPGDIEPADTGPLDYANPSAATPLPPTVYHVINLWLAMALFAVAGLAFLIVSIAGFAAMGVIFTDRGMPSRPISAGSVGLCVVAFIVSLYLFIAAGRCDRAIRRARRQHRAA